MKRSDSDPSQTDRLDRITRFFERHLWRLRTPCMDCGKKGETRMNGLCFECWWEAGTGEGLKPTVH